MSETALLLGPLRDAYRSGALTVAATIETVIGRVAAGDPAVWITRVAEDAMRARARALDQAAAADPAALERLPLFGIPFAVKDNIDVAGLPTTAACPAFAYTPTETAPAVTRLLDAGAVLVGKTNLDQFASGLVGTRSPYGVPRNPYSAAHIPGGSSSGSAAAVAAGEVSFALGTDTAGSGRVPAAFCNLVGLKPTRGRLSARGVVPACRSLDCVSVFARSVEDALAVFDVAAAFDADDPFARQAPTREIEPPGALRLGVPAEAELEFYGDTEYRRLFHQAVQSLAGLTRRLIEVPFAPFRKAAALLYEGPWLAERLHAVEELLQRDPGAILPVTRAIIAGGSRYSALDVFRGEYALAALRREAEPIWRDIDVLVLPTAGTIYTVAEVMAEPMALNTKLGRYTNFANLLDLAVLALPAGFRSDGLPFGISLIAPAFSDHRLAALGRRFQDYRAPAA